MARIPAAALRANVQENWREPRAIEEAGRSIIEKYDGEDVVHPRVRGQFDEAKAT